VLTIGGAAQLAADLAWLANIVEALNVEWAPLRMWRKWVEEEEEEGRRRYRDGAESEPADDNAEDDVDGEQIEDEQEVDGERQVAKVVARLRGWES